MADELKTERIQVLFAPSDLAEIDDWSFSHRIRSRGEAIRILTKDGIRFEGCFETLMAAIKVINYLHSEKLVDLKIFTNEQKHKHAELMLDYVKKLTDQYKLSMSHQKQAEEAAKFYEELLASKGG